MIRQLLGDCRETLATLPPGSAQTIITSPPYWGLRDYGTPPLVWGGDAECAHVWGESGKLGNPGRHGALSRSFLSMAGQSSSPYQDVLARTYPSSGSFCSCGARLGSLGLEPTPELFVEHLVECFRAVRRVLRDDGTCWINMGDSYAGSGNGSNDYREVNKNRSLSLHPDKYVGQKPGRPTAGYKAKDLMEIPSMVAQALRADGWYLRSRIPWLKRNCLSGGARVYVRCQKGDMPMSVKDMARLDPATCKLWNGERWTQLISMWEVPHAGRDQVEIELRSGERIGCTPEHRWPAERGLLSAAELRVGDVLKGSWLPKPEFGSTHRPSALSDAQVGWLVGLYIAEGSMSGGTIQIASHTKEEERFETLCQIAEAYDGTCRAHLKGANSMTINLTGPVLRGIIEQYVGGRVAKDKHLTNRAWMRSNEFLRAVLLGYLSGDGHYDEKNRRWRLGFTRNYAWEADLRTICARLNLDLRLKLATIPYAGREVGIFRGSLRFERTTKLWTKNEREIMRLGRSRGRKFWDIAVEDEPHTFALASGVFTHNSMPESVQDRPATAVEYVFLLSKSARYFWDADAVRQPHSEPGRGNGTVESRTPHTHPGFVEGATWVPANRQYNPNGRSLRNADFFFQTWQGLLLDEHDEPMALVVNPAPFSGAHFATFPAKLVEPMVKASTSEKGCCPVCGAPWERGSEKELVKTRGNVGPRRTRGVDENDFGSMLQQSGGVYGHYEVTTTGWRPSCAHPEAAQPVPCVVLDPFSGAGSTMLVADRLGRNAIGCELKPEYADVGTNRLIGDAPMFVEMEGA